MCRPIVHDIEYLFLPGIKKKRANEGWYIRPEYGLLKLQVVEHRKERAQKAFFRNYRLNSRQNVLVRLLPCSQNPQNATLDDVFLPSTNNIFKQDACCASKRM